MGSAIELTLEELNEGFFAYISSESNADDAANFIYENLLEDVTTGALFEFHHGLKTGLTDLLEGEPEDEEPMKIVTAPDSDVFGFSTQKSKTPDSNCACPNCERPVSATRFAPHLEKCMGMGRNSSRIASRRIASNSREGAAHAGPPSDDDDDADWAGAAGERRRKRMRAHAQRKPHKMHNGSRASNGVSADPLSVPDGAAYDALSAGDRKNLMGQICGVISEHTKKLCTRSGRCPQHTDEQRRAARVGAGPPTPEGALDDAGSPADSSPSSSCSGSGRRRERHRAGRKPRERAPSPATRD